MLFFPDPLGFGVGGRAIQLSGFYCRCTESGGSVASVFAFLASGLLLRYHKAQRIHVSSQRSLNWTA